MSQSNDVLREKITAITDEYGDLHEIGCDLNTEDGAYYGCDCVMSAAVEEILSLLEQSNREARVDERIRVNRDTRNVREMFAPWGQEVAKVFEEEMRGYNRNRIQELQHPEGESDE